jgi:hypothetical protein
VNVASVAAAFLSGCKYSPLFPFRASFFGLFFGLFFRPFLTPLFYGLYAPVFFRGRPDPYLGRRAFGTHAPPVARAIDGTHNVPNGARGLGAQSPKPEGNAVKQLLKIIPIYILCVFVYTVIFAH